MSALIEYAPAKVNLSLHVGRVKDNGRHDLISLVTFADADSADILEAEPSTHFSLGIEGPYTRDCGPARDNLVLQAARAMNSALDGNAPALAFRLIKRLPCAAGIGGGSADCAAALRLIAHVHGEGGMELARAVAPALGGDVLACLISQPGLMTGEGERYEPMLGLPPLPAVLANPGALCPTGPVFQHFDEAGSTLREHPLPNAGRGRDTDFTTYLAADTENALQPPAITLVPDIQTTLSALAALPGARLTRMSGSGATCFALFDTMDAASAAAEALSETHPDWWVSATMLGGG